MWEGLHEMDHVGGAMIAVPETICGPASVVLTSAPERSVAAYEKIAPSLDVLGRLEYFPGDVGYDIACLCREGECEGRGPS